MRMDISRRKALTTVSTTSLLSLAGCSQALSRGDVATGSEPVGVRTVGYNAEAVDDIELIGEVTGVGDADELLATVQRSSDRYDGWSPSLERNLYQFEGIDEPREITRKYPGTIDGGVEYQYRAVIVADGEPVLGNTKTFNLHNLGLDVPRIEFGTPSLNRGEDSVTVETEVQNVSEIQSGRVGVGIDWFGEDDTFLGESGGSLRTLLPGEEGVVTVNPSRDVPQSEITDYEQQTSYGAVFEYADGVEVIETELDSGKITVTAEKSQSNNRGEVEAIARFFDSDGVVIGTVSEDASTSNVPEGKWRFEIDSRRRNMDVENGVEDYEVILSRG